METTSASVVAALEHIRAGNLRQAEQIYHQLEQAGPSEAVAFYGLGAIAYRLGQAEQAIDWLQKARAFQGNDAILHSNLGAAYRASGRLAEAEACYRDALRLKPDFAEAYNNLGNTLQLQGQLPAAVTCYQLAILARPNYAEAQSNLALALRRAGYGDQTTAHSGALSPCLQPLPVPSEAAQALHSLALGSKKDKKLNEAARHCREALELAPDYSVAWFTLGVILARQGNLGEAVFALHQVLRLQPDHALAAMHLGTALREQGHLERAIGYLRYALYFRPELVDAYDQLGLALAEQGKFDDALTAFRQALGLQPDSVSPLSHLGNLFEEAGQADEGQHYLRQALDLGPDQPQVQVHYGSALVNRGRFDEARAHFLKALALQPDFAPAIFALARDSRHVFTDAEGARIKELLQRESLPLRDQINLHFALARVLDQARDFDGAFFHCNQGNACKRQLLQTQGNAFQSEAHAQFVDQLITAYDPAYFLRVESFGSDSDLPVFIVGMPRSGTSLVEQILASHPAVYGAGEIRNLKQLVAELPQALGNSLEYPGCLRELDQAASRRLADGYLQGLRRLGGDKLRVTDKVPMNFHQLGLIATLLPGAQIIHCRRDPLDVCWSCYFQNFREVPFACDLRMLGMYYRQYERLMAHWKKVLPLPILEVRYEDLVVDFERFSREIVAFCRLPWHEACSTFYQTDRLVRTSSNLQVRQPVYQKSVGNWKNYAPHLAPLQEALNGS
jgi:tetratricopeptide (TPR) repeat protein